MKRQLIIIISVFLLFSCQTEKGAYVCTPCDLPCDALTFKEPGICPHCNMALVKKNELIDESTLVLNEVNLSKGSGVFLIEGAEGKAEKPIKVYYHQPENYTIDSNILMVIPGAGRNGDSYRDAWVEESERYNVLILSPMFEEENYPFETYHLCGLIKDSNLGEAVVFSDSSNIAVLDENMFNFQLNPNASEWLFNDFDRIFDAVVQATGSSQTEYDLFGHSAGGQVLHRLAIFSKTTKADRIIAANSGFYTLPDFETKMPFGIKNTGISKDDLKSSFSKKLTLLIGQLDNETETSGTLLRSNTVDKQGLHRLARAHHFYEFSQKKAKELGLDFNWEIHIALNIGHNHELIGNVAAILFYSLTIQSQIHSIILNQYKDDKKGGLWREYYKNGQLKRENNYKDGKKQGLCKEWWENGKLWTKGYYVNDKANGWMKWYNDKGEFAAEGNMTAGKRDGLWKICDFHNTSNCIEASFKAGKKIGIWKLYHDNGKLWKEQNWEDGKVVTEKCWDENGLEIDCE